MQRFKSISFPDGSRSKSKVVSLAFTDKDDFLFQFVEHFSSADIRNLINIYTYEDLCLKAKSDRRNISQYIKVLLEDRLHSGGNVIAASDVTFKNNKIMPFHRWYPYIEGYSPDFVKKIIREFLLKKCIIYDPFVGTGTTIFAADELLYRSYYSEVNPLLQFLVRVKIEALKLDIMDRKLLASNLKNSADSLIEFKCIEDKTLNDNYNNVFRNSTYFPKENYSNILRTKTFIDTLNPGLQKDLLTVATLSSLIECSYLKKQGDLRFRTQKELTKGICSFKEAFVKNVNCIIEDLISYPEMRVLYDHKCISINAKDIDKCTCEKIGCIITSPPYLNGTNYIRNTKLELWFLGILKDESDLRSLRDEILTSGINDVKLTDKIDNTIANYSALLKSTIQALQDNAYDARIPQMAISYFSEMFSIFNGLKDKLEIDADVFIDIGDSIFNGVHIRTDKILIEILDVLGFNLVSLNVLRERRSRNGMIISQKLIHLKYTPFFGQDKWEYFKVNLPHQKLPFSKKNWGNENHSLCSYQGKLKPAIAYHLVSTFVPEGGSILDPFSGVGTIPFEASLNGRLSYGIDISIMAYYISQAKVGITNKEESYLYIDRLKQYIGSNKVSQSDFISYSHFGLNKVLSDYYEPHTFNEILLARNFFHQYPPRTPSEMVVISSLLHILHGNRPYALSRRSHPITPYAPTGEFVYRNLIDKLTQKVNRFYQQGQPTNFVPGTIYLQDSTLTWPEEISGLDAIITSPPFYDSTRFYNTNWIRLWFCGWEKSDFKEMPKSYVDERQRQSFDVYNNIFSQAKDRLKYGGVLVFHLGKSKKCDMGEQLLSMGKKWFNHYDLFHENVEHCETFGLKDIGTVTNHEYLVLY